MRKSQISKRFEITPEQWVISVINTKQSIKINTKQKSMECGVLSGHVKIVVEGAKQNPTLFDTEYFMTEYHIMEANAAEEKGIIDRGVIEQDDGVAPHGLRNETWIPQCFRNTKSQYIILINENPTYTEKQKEIVAKSIFTRSFYRSPAYIKKMTDAIEKERKEIESGEKISNFQYFGNWTVFNYNGGHNCATWASEKLDLAGIKDFKFTDYLMAPPSSHTSSSSSSSSCLIL